MRRREPRVDPAHEPLARLRAHDEADWLPLLDPSGYDPKDYRNRNAAGPYGPPWWTFEAWRRQQALTMLSRARLEWRTQYGWPGGLDYVELLQETVRLKRSHK